MLGLHRHPKCWPIDAVKCGSINAVMVSADRFSHVGFGALSIIDFQHSEEEADVSTASTSDWTSPQVQSDVDGLSAARVHGLGGRYKDGRCDSSSER